MKVLILSHLYPTQENPVLGIFIHEQAKALQKAGIEVLVAQGLPLGLRTYHPKKVFSTLGEYRAKPLQWSERDGVRSVTFSFLAGRRFFSQAAQTRRYVAGFQKKLREIQERFPFYLIHAHTSLFDGSAALVASRHLGIPYFITEHTGPFSDLLKTVGTRSQTEAALRGAQKVLAVSHSLALAMSSEFAWLKDIEIIPNGVDTEFFVPAQPIQGPTQALWIGHYQEIKQYEMLLRAFSLAVRKEPKLTLKLIAPYPPKNLTGLLKELEIENHVHVFGGANRVQIREELQRASFLVISSKIETFGVVAIEALCTGVPVLSTKCGGPEDILTKPSVGLLVNNDLESLASGLIAMVRGQNQFSQGTCRQHGLENFSHQIIAEKLGKIYDSASI